MTSNDIYKEEFLAIVTRSDGRLSPKSINEQFFTKKDKLHLWVHYIESTKLFDQYDTKDRIFFWVSNITHIQYCLCGNPCMTINYTAPKTYSKYCSQKCSLIDKEPRKIGASKRDEKVAASKRAITMIEKYGAKTNLERLEIKQKLQKPKVSPKIITLLTDKDWLIEQYVTLNRTSVEIGDELGCFYGTVLSYLKTYNIPINYFRNTSKEETQIKEYIESLGVVVIQSDRSQLGNRLELDLYIPDHNFAIEMNGSYWHSFSYKESEEERTKHKRKHLLAKEKNISLLQITDIEWNNNKPLVQSMIRNKLGLSIKIHARKCTSNLIPYKEYTLFCINNHISGVARASRVYGLRDESGELISILSFANSRFKNKEEWEVIRFCTKQGYTIRGGFSKLLSKFIKYENPTTIGTYSDNRYGTGGVYESNGFVHIKSSEPGYCWTDTQFMMNRYLCQKKKLPDLLGDKFDSNKSESSNMFGAKYRRMWDAGHEYWRYNNLV